MDIKHRKAYARVKQIGVKDEKVFNEGMGVTILLANITAWLFKSQNRYEGVEIEIRFKPIELHQTSQEKAYAAMLDGLDLSLMEQATDEDESLPKSWPNNPINPESPHYDPLFSEYELCHISSHRERKTPEDLTILRRHVETNYRDSVWWDGSHRW